MNKRGQIYLIAALITGLLIFVLTNQPNKISMSVHDEDFKLISQNYNQESSKFLSTMINTQTPSDKVSNRFRDFSIFFSQYSKTQNPSFGMIYFLNYDNNLYMGNFFDKEIKVDFLREDGTIKNSKTLNGCYEYIKGDLKYGTAGSLKIFFDLGNFIDCVKTESFSQDDNKDKMVQFKIGKENIIYEVNLISGQPEVVVLSRENVAEDRKVFVEKQFIKGKRDREHEEDDD